MKVDAVDSHNILVILIAFKKIAWIGQKDFDLMAIECFLAVLNTPRAITSFFFQNAKMEYVYSALCKYNSADRWIYLIAYMSRSLNLLAADLNRSSILIPHEVLIAIAATSPF